MLLRCCLIKMTIIIHFIFYIKYIFVQREIILDCFSFSCSGYDFTLIKKSHTLNYYLFLQIYFISFMSFSINKFKSHKFFTCKNFVFQFYIEKNISLQEMEVGLVPPSHCPKSMIQLPLFKVWHDLYKNFIFLSTFIESKSLDPDVRNVEYF